MDHNEPSEKFRDWPLARVVVSLVPQVGGRQNEIRYEVVVSAFSRGLALKSGDTWITALGDDPPELVRKCLADAEFAVVFKPQSVNVRNREGWITGGTGPVLAD